MNFSGQDSTTVTRKCNRIFHVPLTIDKVDCLHVAWSTINTKCYDQAVYYARSEFSGEVWEEAVMLQDADINNGFTGFPVLISYRPNNLIISHVDQSNIGCIELTDDC